MNQGSEKAAPIEAPDLASKAIADLDDLIQAILGSLPASKPWQRQLRLHLSEADRHIQVLRLTLSLRRAKDEVVQARDALVGSVRAANAYVNGGRADMGTRTAILLAHELARKAGQLVEA